MRPATQSSNYARCPTSMGRRRLVLCPLLALTMQVSEAGDWTQFRGPNGSGVSTSRDLPLRFGPQENVRWKTSLPPGHSSPVFSREIIFVTGFHENRLSTTALDRKTGEIRWTRDVARTRKGELHRDNSPASPSPVTDGSNVYVFFQDLGLLAYDAHGNELWRVPLGPYNTPFGIGGSPVLAGNHVVQVCDGESGSFMVAVDKKTGRIAWRNERPLVRRGFSTPVLYRPQGGELQVLVPGSFQLVAYSAATGGKIWWSRGLTWQMKPTPVLDAEYAYVLGWAGGADPGKQEDILPFAEVLKTHDRNGDRKLSKEEAVGALAANYHKAWDTIDLDLDSQMGERDWEIYRLRRASVNSVQRIRLGGKGDTTVTARGWQYHKSLPNVPSPLLYERVLYLIKDGGIVTTLDPGTGAVFKQGRLKEAMSRYFASPVGGDGKVYLLGENGDVSVLRAAPEWEVLAVNRMDEDCYATPALVDGKIYLRTVSALYCFD